MEMYQFNHRSDGEVIDIHKTVITAYMNTNLKGLSRGSIPTYFSTRCVRVTLESDATDSSSGLVNGSLPCVYGVVVKELSS